MSKRLTEQDITTALYNADVFINEYCKIEVTGKGLQPFHLYEYQKKALASYTRNNAVIDLKSRQLGFTTLAAAFALWTVYFPGNNVLFLSKKEDDAMDIVRKVRIMYENLPPELKIPITTSNQTTIELVNKNRIQSLPATDRAGAGKSASLIILDEFSAFPSAKGEVAGDNVWMAILPTISTGGKIIVQSTPKGVGNKFYQIWAGKNGFVKHTFHWTDHPIFGEDKYYRKNPEDGYGIWGSPWADEIMKNMTSDQWGQEYNCDFVQSGRPVFDWNVLTKHEIGEEDTKYNCHYACGVDISSGSSKDYSVAVFINVDTGKIVHTYRSQDPIDAFATQVVDLCEKYSDAFLAFENNSGFGVAFMQGVRDYENLYYQVVYDKKKEKKSRKLGWNTNVKTKQLMITDLNIALINKRIKLTDQRTIDECRTYQYDDNDSMNAMAGCNDDCVMALAIAWQAAKNKKYDGEDVETAFKRRIGRESPVVDKYGRIPVPDGLLFQKIPQKSWRVA